MVWFLIRFGGGLGYFCDFLLFRFFGDFGNFGDFRFFYRFRSFALTSLVLFSPALSSLVLSPLVLSSLVHIFLSLTSFPAFRFWTLGGDLSVLIFACLTSLL